MKFHRTLGTAAATCLLLALCVFGAGGIAQDAEPDKPIDLSDTEWVGLDLMDGRPIVHTYRFEKGGVLAYGYRGKSYRNGTWKQNGKEVYFETNKMYREWKGLLKDEVIEADSWNKKDQKQKVVLYKYTKPE